MKVFMKPVRLRVAIQDLIASTPSLTMVSFGLVIAVITFGCRSNAVHAQDIGGGGQPPVIDTPVVSEPVPVVPDTVNNADNVNRQSGNVSTGDGLVDPRVLDLGGDREDVRNQGFVGATADRSQEQGFVGAATSSSGPPLADGATFGGGVNGGTSGGLGGNRGNFAAGGGFGQGGFGQQGFGASSQNGVQVIRRNLRGRLVPRFSSPVVSSNQLSERFLQRLSRQPSTAATGGDIRISIENKTATLTGFVDSTEQRDQIERQLRLEPGVYQIENRIEVR